MNARDTGGQQTTKGFQKGNKLGKKFTKGDPRINRNGRPKNFDELRSLAQEIAHEEITLPDGRKLTKAAALLYKWFQSSEPSLQKAFMEYAYGKVPDKIEGEILKKTLHLHYDHEQRGNGSRLSPAVPSGPN